jgi:hypothetical protein
VETTTATALLTWAARRVRQRPSCCKEWRTPPECIEFANQCFDWQTFAKMIRNFGGTFWSWQANGNGCARTVDA